MRLRSVLTVFSVLAVALTACTSGDETHSVPLANGRAVGEIRGTMLINKQIQRRILDSDDNLTDTFQIEMVAGPEVFSMRGLLGEYSEGGAHAEFRGGEANPFGMLLWHQVAARFAEGLGRICESTNVERSLKFFGSSGFMMSQSFAEKLAANCDSSLSVVELKANASGLWRAFMGIGASSEEGPWIDFFTDTNSGFISANGSERVSAMILSMMLNPHLLLEK